MRQTECVAMLLAGGEGRRLGVLTARMAKPVVPFGGKFRLIDFTLSNCRNSGIDTIGVLTQYQAKSMSRYIGAGDPWKSLCDRGCLTLLSSSALLGGGYRGTANAIFQNIDFIERRNPRYVLVISGDHIYRMNYRNLIDFHKQTGAEATISVIPVKWEEAGRFGIMKTEGDRIVDFEEKPAEPKSNLASMGIYVFNWDVLKKYLYEDERTPGTTNDFGKDVIPAMLRGGAKLYAYPFEGYWKDVGTVDSLWEAHMDLLENQPLFAMDDPEWPVYSACPSASAPQYIAPTAAVHRSIVNDGCAVYGEVEHSILFSNVEVGRGSLIKDSVVMADVKIGENVTISRAIIGEGAVIRDGAVVGDAESAKVTVIGEREVVAAEEEKVPALFAEQRLVLSH